MRQCSLRSWERWRLKEVFFVLRRREERGRRERELEEKRRVREEKEEKEKGFEGEKERARRALSRGRNELDA